MPPRPKSKLPAPRPLYFLSLPLPPILTHPPLPAKINPPPALHHITLALFLSPITPQQISQVLHQPALNHLFSQPVTLNLGAISTFSRRGQVGVVYAECGSAYSLPSATDPSPPQPSTLNRAQGILALRKWARSVREVFISSLPEGSVLTRDDGGEDTLHVTLWKAGGRERNCPVEWKELRVDEGCTEVEVGEVRVCRVGSGGKGEGEGYEVLDRRALGEEGAREKEVPVEEGKVEVKGDEVGGVKLEPSSS